MEEIWKPVVGYEGYYDVSDLGRVRSRDIEVPTKGGLKAKRKGRVLKQMTNIDGYHTVMLCKNGARRIWRVHILVGIVFVPNPHGYSIINHKDRNPANNMASNLEWCSVAYNVTYDGARARSSETRYKNKRGFKRVAQYGPDGSFLAFFESVAGAARAIGCRQGAISNCCAGRTKTAGGFRWAFVPGTEFEVNNKN